MTTCSRCSVAFVVGVAVVCLAVGSPAHAQILGQDQEIQLHDLPSLRARSQDQSDVLLTSLDRVIHDGEICCGKDSALER